MPPPDHWVSSLAQSYRFSHRSITSAQALARSVRGEGGGESTYRWKKDDHRRRGGVLDLDRASSDAAAACDLEGIGGVIGMAFLTQIPS